MTVLIIRQYLSGNMLTIFFSSPVAICVIVIAIFAIAGHYAIKSFANDLSHDIHSPWKHWLSNILLWTTSFCIMFTSTIIAYRVINVGNFYQQELVKVIEQHYPDIKVFDIYGDDNEILVYFDEKHQLHNGKIIYFNADFFISPDEDSTDKKNDDPVILPVESGK